MILRSRPGENPWDRGPMENFKSVFGDRWYDWILPLKYSPCCNHDGSESQFALGPVVERMRKEAGLSTSSAADLGGRPARRKYRRSRPDTGSSHGRSGAGFDELQGQREIHHGSNNIERDFGIARGDTHGVGR